MRQEIQIGANRIAFDREKTVACYSGISVPSPEECGCAYCRNWVLARHTVITEEVRRFLAQFGVPPNGEIEVWEAPSEKMPHLYGGWYFIVGEILKGSPEDAFKVSGMSMNFLSDHSFRVSEFDGHEICELHFDIEVGEFLDEAEYGIPPTSRI